jgi:hypothetical protein
VKLDDLGLNVECPCACFEVQNRESTEVQKLDEIVAFFCMVDFIESRNVVLEGE